MKTALLLLLLMTLVWATFTVDTSQVTADILPRVRCRFSKDLYQYGEPVIFYLDVDILPNTILGDMYLEELRPDGSVNTLSFGVLGQGSYEFIIGKAASPPGYRYCTLMSRKEDSASFVDIVRWKGGYSVEAGSSPAPTQPPNPSPTSTRTSLLPQPTNVPSGQASTWPWLPPLLVIIVVAAVLLVLYRGIGAEESTRTEKEVLPK